MSVCNRKRSVTVVVVVVVVVVVAVIVDIFSRSYCRLLAS